MTPEEIGARLASALGGRRPEGSADPERKIIGDGRAVTATVGAGPGAASAAAGAAAPTVSGAAAPTVSGGGPFARATVDVPVGQWRAAVLAGRDDPELDLDFFDWLSAVDEEDGGFELVVHLWSTVKRHGVLIRTRLTDRAAPGAPSIVDLYPGAGWHERETREMFGITFTAPDTGEPVAAHPLLLPPEFEGHPLRKDFVLATRVAKPWPGAKEPGESGHGPAKRQPMRPPGVPDPREWGPTAGQAGPADEPGPRRAPAAPGAAARPRREPGAARTPRPQPVADPAPPSEPEPPTATGE